MRNIIFLITLSFLFNSCSKEKSYEYIEILYKKDISGKGSLKESKPIIIKAETDSIAYLLAYSRYCVSEKVHKQMQNEYGSFLDSLFDFRLLDKNGIDISKTINFEKIDSLKSLKRMITFGVEEPLGLEDYAQEELKIDSTKINELKPLFNIKKDEFDPDGNVWYTPKTAPKYVNRNGIYCYFQTIDEKPITLRLRLQYHSDDWLFFKKVQFSIDSTAYEFVPNDTERDSGNGGRIWEWFDESMGTTNTELLNALANAKTVKMKLIGSQYYDIKTISSKEIKSIKETLELFSAMGGSY